MNGEGVQTRKHALRAHRLLRRRFARYRMENQMSASQPLGFPYAYIVSKSACFVQCCLWTYMVVAFYNLTSYKVFVYERVVTV